MQLLEDEPELTEKLGEVPVAVIEKGKAPRRAPALRRQHAPVGDAASCSPTSSPTTGPSTRRSTKDAVYLLTKNRALPLKPMPPNFRNHGNYVTSVAKLGRFLGEKAEEAGAYLLTETAADKLLVEDRIVKGVRSGDKGRGRDGEELVELRARLRRDREGDRARRGHAGPPHRRRDRLLRPRAGATRSAGSSA